MLFHKTECPHCGNDVTVNDSKDVHKCRWCRRLISVKFERGKGKRYKCEVEPMDFNDNESFGKRSYSDWERNDIYGNKRN